MKTGKTARGPVAVEKKTVAAMVDIFCAAHHGGSGELCADCAALLAYSHQRLDRCPYGGDKPSCRNCPVHCYRPAERAAMQEVMRFAGPKMIFRRPWLALIHLWKERFSRRQPGPPPRRRAGVAAERAEGRAGGPG